MTAVNKSPAESPSVPKKKLGGGSFITAVPSHPERSAVELLSPRDTSSSPVPLIAGSRNSGSKKGGHIAVPLPIATAASPSTEKTSPRAVNSNSPPAESSPPGLGRSVSNITAKDALAK
jgi:hypothetical protein